MPLLPSITNVFRGWRQGGQEEFTGQIQQHMENQLWIIRDPGAPEPPLDFNGVQGLPNGAHYTNAATGQSFQAQPQNGPGTTATNQAGANPLVWEPIPLAQESLTMNPDFAISQRGSGPFALASNTWAYTVDRWLTFTLGSALTITKTLTGIRLSKAAGTAGTVVLGQALETSQSDRLAGRRITSSLRFAVPAGSSVTGVTQTVAHGTQVDSPIFSAMNAQWASQANVLSSAAAFTPGVTTTAAASGMVPTTARQIGTLIYVSFGAGAGDIDLHYSKLEIGGLATPLSPPDPSTELAKCQRFFERLSYPGRIVMGNALNASTATFPPVRFIPKRAAPSVTLPPNGQIRVLDNTNGAPANEGTLSVTTIDDRFMEFLVLNAAGLPSGSVVTLWRGPSGPIDLSAEI
jgi:hypothetical protein